MRPIRESGPPAIDTIGPTAYRALQTQIDPAYPPGNRDYWRSNFLRGIEDEAIDAIVSRSAGLPDPLPANLDPSMHLSGFDPVFGKLA